MLLPISKQWKLLIFGVRTTGVAVDYKILNRRADYNSEYAKTTIFQYQVGNKAYRILGPSNSVYELGEERRIIYDQKRPSKSMIPSLAYLYSFHRIIIPILILLVWIAFYTSFTPPGKR
jgi:hypothetical protein